MESTDTVRWAVNAFILLYLFVTWAWRHPPGTFGRVATEPVVHIVRWLGLGQHWSMFTPNPASVGADLQVIVKRKSGAAIVWEPPRLDAVSRWRAFRLFRYRTYANAIMSTWAESSRATLADYLLRKYDFGDDPAVEIVYTWLERPVPAPGEAVAADPPRRVTFFTFAVPEPRA